MERRVDMGYPDARADRAVWRDVPLNTGWFMNKRMMAVGSFLVFACGGLAMGADAPKANVQAPASPPAQEKARILAPFKDQIKDQYPAHVAGMAVVKATVVTVAEEAYCPMRTSRCGKNPTCEHPKKITRVYSFHVTETVLNAGDVPVPPHFDGWSSFDPALTLKAGDAVYLSFYVYRNNCPPQISRVVPAK